MVLPKDFREAADGGGGGEYDPLAGLVRISDVDPERIEWIWPGRIAKGKVHVADGDPGLGKSLVMGADIAARFTNGATMPGELTALHKPTNVLILSNEDGAADTIRPRADIAGADVTRIFHVEGFPTPDQPNKIVPPKLPSDHGCIEHAIRELEIGFMIIDPISSFIEDGYNQNADAHMRAILDPLAKIAERTGCSIVVLRHPNKKAGARAIDRGSGATGIGGAARVLMMFGWHPDDIELEDLNDRRRALAISKVNIAKYASTVTYSIHGVPYEIDGEIVDIPRIKWGGAISATADMLVGAEGTDDGHSDDAVVFLSRVLSDGPMLYDHIKKEASEAGFSMDQLKRAKKRAHVTSDKQPGVLSGKWFWCLK